MRNTRNAVLGIVTMMSGAILAVPTDAAERYIPGGYVYKAGPERLFSYPYGGTHLRVDYAKRRFGYPYVGSYYGSYYAPPVLLRLPLSLLLVMRRLQQQFLTARAGRAIGSR